MDLVKEAADFAEARAREAADLTQFDREWLEALAGRELTVSEALELKREFDEWVELVERTFG